MGFASMLEDILDRSSLGAIHVAPRDTLEMSSDLARNLIAALCAEYEARPPQERRLRDLTGSYLGRVEILIRTVKESEAILRSQEVGFTDATSRQLDESRSRLLGHFADPQSI